jgi:tetratricopeptide (TPR) repeat protein
MEEATALPRRPTKSQRLLVYLRDNGAAVSVFGIAFLTRLLYLVAHSDSPFFQVQIADALYHREWAERILGGDIFSLAMPGVLYKAPLYPYFIALSYLVSGHSTLFLMFLQVVMAAGSCLLLFLIGRRYFGPAAGLIGAFTYGFYFPSVYFSAEMEIPTLGIFLTLLSFCLLSRSQGRLSLVFAAVVFGLSLLTLPTNLLLLPLYVLMLLRREGGARREIKKAALYAVVVLGTILPCTLRNLAAGKHLTLISANGGINFYIGNNAHYDATVYLQPGYAFEHFYDEPRRVAGVDSFVDRDRYWYGKAFDFVLAQPGQAARLLLKKLVLYFADYEIYRNTDSYYAKANSIYRGVPFVPASLILATGLGGLLLALRRRRAAELIAFCLLQALPCLLFFVTDRYRLPSMGVWALFSGFFVTSMAALLRARAWPTVIGGLAGVVCLAVVSNLNLFVVKNPAYRPHFNLGFIYETQTKYDRALEEYSAALQLLEKTEPRDLETESEIHARLGNVHMMAGRLEAARESFARAIEVNSRSAPAYSYLGTLYGKQGQRELAAKMFNRALALNPWDVVSLHNYGLLLLNQRQIEAALANFKRVLELAPEHAGAHNNLAYIYGMQGKYDWMEAEARKAIYFNPAGASARYNLASLYLHTGRIEEAVAEYRTIVRTLPREASNAYNQLGVISAQRGDLKQAIEHWQKALEGDPGNEDARANLQQAQRMMR